jgi:hypothetical protein
MDKRGRRRTFSLTVLKSQPLSLLKDAEITTIMSFQ